MPEKGFDGIILTIFGSRDSSNPIAINGQLTGKLQYLTVTLEDIGRIERVLLANVNQSISIDWIEILPDKAHPTLLTETERSDNRIMVMKGLKYRIFTMAGNKLRKVNFRLSIRLIGMDGESELHDLLTDTLRIGRDVETSFYDRNIGVISAIRLYLDGKTSGAGTIIHFLKHIYRVVQSRK